MSASPGLTRGKGGTYILLPPDYTGEVPKDGFVYRSRTYNVFLFWRAFFTTPTICPRPMRPSGKTRVYPLGKKDQAKPMVFPDANALPANMLFPQDGSYFDMLSRFIDAEYADPADNYMRVVFADDWDREGQALQSRCGDEDPARSGGENRLQDCRVMANDMIMQERRAACTTRTAMGECISRTRPVFPGQPAFIAPCISRLRMA